MIEEKEACGKCELREATFEKRTSTIYHFPTQPPQPTTTTSNVQLQYTVYYGSHLLLSALSTKMNGTGHTAEEAPIQQENQPQAMKKLLLAIISFIPAFLLVSILNYALTQLLVTNAAPKVVTEAPKLQPKVVTKTVYIEPSEADIARLRSELEATDPLPPIVAESRSSQIESLASSLKEAVNARKEKEGSANRQYAELKAAHASFVQRFDEDVARLVSTARDDNVKSVKLLEEKLSSLKSVLSLTEFSSRERKNLTDMFASAAGGVEWLLHSDKGLFQNHEGVLLEALVAETADNCSSFLNLDRVNVVSELSIPPVNSTKNRSKSGGDIHVQPGTARESDLYQSVQNIKEILSRRDASLMKPNANGSIPSPLGEKGTSRVLKEIRVAAGNAERQRQALVAQLNEQIVEPTVPGNTSAETKNGTMCANSSLVELMVAGGLESLRKQSDLSTELRATLFSALVNGQELETKDMNALHHAMQDVDGVKIDYEKQEHLSVQGAKSNRKSFYYLLDGPLLHIGFAGWINSLVDFISGYEDNIDAMLDWIVGDGKSTVGEIIVDAVLRIARHIPCSDEFAERLKPAGILAGKTRDLLG